MRRVKECLSGIPIRLARKFHKIGIKLEDERSYESIETPIKNPDAGKEIERFYCLTREWHGQNTSQNVTNSDIQFLKFNRNRQPHISIITNTKKEQASAKTFFSNESRQLSDKYELKF